MIDEGELDEPTAKEAAIECIDDLREAYILNKLGIQQDVVDAIGPQKMAAMPEEKREILQDLLREDESDYQDNDPSRFCSCQKTARGGVDEPK